MNLLKFVDMLHSSIYILETCTELLPQTVITFLNAIIRIQKAIYNQLTAFNIE